MTQQEYAEAMFAELLNTAPGFNYAWGNWTYQQQCKNNKRPFSIELKAEFLELLAKHLRGVEL